VSFSLCWIRVPSFPQKIRSRIANPVDPQHPRLSPKIAHDRLGIRGVSDLRFSQQGHFRCRGCYGRQSRVRLSYHGNEGFNERSGRSSRSDSPQTWPPSGRPTRRKGRGGRIVLTPRSARARKVSIVVDTITGLPALSAGPDAQLLSSKQVYEILSDFP